LKLKLKLELKLKLKLKLMEIHVFLWENIAWTGKKWRQIKILKPKSQIIAHIILNGGHIGGAVPPIISSTYYMYISML
jgi:hypothetical protein